MYGVGVEYIVSGGGEGEGNGIGMQSEKKHLKKVFTRVLNPQMNITGLYDLRSCLLDKNV